MGQESLTFPTEPLSTWEPQERYHKRSSEGRRGGNLLWGSLIRQPSRQLLTAGLLGMLVTRGLQAGQEAERRGGKVPCFSSLPLASAGNDHGGRGQGGLVSGRNASLGRERALIPHWLLGLPKGRRAVQSSPQVSTPSPHLASWFCVL